MAALRPLAEEGHESRSKSKAGEGIAKFTHARRLPVGVKDELIDRESTVVSEGHWAVRGFAETKKLTSWAMSSTRAVYMRIPAEIESRTPDAMLAWVESIEMDVRAPRPIACQSSRAMSGWKTCVEWRKAGSTMPMGVQIE